MSKRLSNEQRLRYYAKRFPATWQALRSCAAEAAVLHARVADLETALLDCKRYAEDHDDEWIPGRVDEAVKQE